MKKQIVSDGKAGSCYFKTTVTSPYRKAILQITNVCNLHCAHCFVSSTTFGYSIPYADVEKMVSQFMMLNVITVTLTGGEPFMHPEIIKIVKLLRRNNIEISICTNATLVSEEHVMELANIGNVHFNVSLDGFSVETHGIFRGDKDSFIKTCETIRILNKYNLMKGILVTPNTLTPPEEYVDLCKFAVDNNAKYVLMNPLSNFGRGIKSINSLAASKQMMENIRTITERFQESTKMVFIRFPNKNLPLLGCEAGRIFYIFTNGDVAICPYLVFAAKNPRSKYDPIHFIAGNIFDSNIDTRINNLVSNYIQIRGMNETCLSCYLRNTCGKGCPASIIASGKLITEIDQDVCPIMYKENPNE